MKYLCLVLFLFSNLPALADETLAIDQHHSAVVFNWDYRGFSHPVARLEKLEGKIVLNRSDITKSSVSVSMPLEGLRTGVELLDRHLQGDEFFNATKYPVITFKSTRIVKGPMDTLEITGDLSMHGMTRPVVLHARINRIQPGQPGQPVQAGFEADAMLRRTDFAVDKYVPAVSDEIDVHITLEAFQEA
jgi:polyisoprenoid-binding protein YceI